MDYGFGLTNLFFPYLKQLLRNNYNKTKFIYEKYQVFNQNLAHPN